MPPGPTFHPAVLAAALLVATGCGHDYRGLLAPNRPPELRIARAETSVSATQFAYRFDWRAEDPDGRVSHCLWALDPSSADPAAATWNPTTSSTAALQVPRRAVPGRATAPGEEVHVFSVRAVDDRGAMSQVVSLAMVGTNLAPSVTILEPVWSTPLQVIPTNPIIRWVGSDIGGRITRYKYRLFGPGGVFSTEPDWITIVRSRPDSLLRYYAPAFAGWDSVGPEVTSVQFHGLIPGESYVFAVVAFDDAGQYSRFEGVVAFSVGTAVLGPPQISVFSRLFTFQQLSGQQAAVELPAELALDVGWSAVPEPGSVLVDYRWVLDPLDLADEKPRTHPTADPNHWSAWGATRQVTLGPFRSARSNREAHLLSLQARDTEGRVGTFTLRFTVAPAGFGRDLLVVNDTRLTPDQLTAGGALAPPRGQWPSAAELDTFLFAQGGKPWRGYPAGNLSPRGLLAGYDFDTLGTRALVTGIVPLAVLSRYRHVLWMTDDISSTYVGDPAAPLQPITSLRFMSQTQSCNTLSAYVARGGHLWLCGGGAAYATLAAWQRRSTAPDEFTKADGELVAGRFMYDFAHWQSALTVKPERYVILNSKNILSLVYPGDPGNATASPGRGWSGHGLERDLAQPNYARLDAELILLIPRTRATDPPWPWRPDVDWFYPYYFTAEFMGTASAAEHNFVREDADPRPNHEREESTLDTLFVTFGAVTAPRRRPVMTYYHGFECGSVVFSGFPIWLFQRTQVATLVDFVLQDIWGLRREPGSGGGATVANRTR